MAFCSCQKGYLTYRWEEADDGNRTEQNRTERELTGFPSIDKPWLKYYSEEAIQTSLPQKTLYGYLYENNRNHMESIALNYFGNRITYQKFFEHIKETADAFATAGIKQGDMVTILSLLTPETIYCIYALNYIGAVANMGYLSFSEDEIVQMVEKTNSKAIIVLDVATEKVIHVQERLTSGMMIILPVESSMPWLMKSILKLKKKKLPNDGNRVLTYPSFVKEYAGQKQAAEVQWEEDQPAVLVYISGTTGEPKGVVLTNDNINAVAFQYRYSGLKFKTGETILAFMPPFLAIGFCLNVHMPLTLGLEEILGPNPDSDVITKLYKKNKPNHFVAAPTNILQIIDAMQGKSMSHCITLAGGGESMTPQQEEMVNTYLAEHGSDAKYITGYGMTEFAATVTTGLNNVYQENTLGIPLCKTIVKIVDTETGKELPYGEVGELCFHTPSQMKEYYQNLKETGETIRQHEDGMKWIHTGDLGWVDQDGFVHFKGRMKRIYMTQGEDGTLYKVFPARTEMVLMELGNVKKCAVMVRMEGKLVKEQIAYLVLDKKAEKENVLKTVRTHCRKMLPSHSVPGKYIILDEIPLTQSGKTDYRALEKIKID